jgi:hypothetical protein
MKRRRIKIRIQVLTLLTGAFSVSLPLLKVGMLGCVVMDIAPLCQFEPSVSLV